MAYLSQNLPPSSGSYAFPAGKQATETGGYLQKMAPETADAVRYGLEHGWYGWLNSDFSSVKAAIDQAIQTGADLAGLLPKDLASENMQIALPGTESSPVVVAPPTSTPAPATVSKPADALSAVYFADPDLHVSQETVKQLADAFNRAHPDMYLEIATERTDWQGGFFDMYDVTHFDCFAEQGGSLVTWITDPALDFAGKVLPLDPLIDANSSSWLEEINPALLEAARLDGSHYSLPVAIKPYLVYYNADLLKSLGLKDPSPDWTPQDFWALATQAAALKTGVYGYAPAQVYPLQNFLSDAQLLDFTQTYPDAVIDTPEMLALLQQLQDLAGQSALFPLDTGGTLSNRGNVIEGLNAILSGKVLLWLSQSGPTYQRQAPDFEVKVAAMPVEQTASTADSISLYIARQAQNSQVCWAWFKYLQEQPVNLFQGIPARQAVIDSNVWAATVGEETAAVYRATMAKLKVTPDLLPYPPPPLLQWWNDTLVSVYQGKDPAPVLRGTQFKAQAMLDCMKAEGVSPTSPSEEMYTTANACAHQVDPNFHSQTELSQTGNHP